MNIRDKIKHGQQGQVLSKELGTHIQMIHHSRVGIFMMVVMVKLKMPLVIACMAIHWKIMEPLVGTHVL